jgi:hypothetical protein
MRRTLTTLALTLSTLAVTGGVASAGTPFDEGGFYDYGILDDGPEIGEDGVEIVDTPGFYVVDDWELGEER